MSSSACELLYDDAERERDVINMIESQPTIEAIPVVHGEWLEVNEHMWKRDENGEIDEWGWENGYHNGPVCKLCYYSPCIHCKPDYESTECREISYKCSVCGTHKEEKTDFCPDCGADMRKVGAEWEK